MSVTERPWDSDRLPGGDALVLVLDEHGTVLTCAPRADKLTGHRAEELRGQRLVDLLADPGPWPGTAAAAGGQPVSGHVTLRQRDGAVVEMRLAVVPLPDWNEARFLAHLTPASVVRRREEDTSLVRALFSQSRIGLAVYDAELLTTRANITHDTLGLPSSGSLPAGPGTSLEDVLVPADAAVFRNRLRHVADTGQPLVDWVHPARFRSVAEHERTLSLSAFRLHDEYGGVLGVAIFCTDVTEATGHQAARGRMTLLHAASERIGRTLEVERNAEELAQVLVPDFAHLASVDLTETVVTGDEPGAFITRETLLRRVAAVSSDGRWPSEIYAAGETFAAGERPSKGLRAGSPVLRSDLTAMRARLVDDPDSARLSLPDAATSMLVVPLLARGQVLGALGLWRTAERPPFNQDDAVLAEEIVSRAALSVDNARRYTREHRTLETLQRSLLPEALVEVGAAETAGTYVPAGTAAGIGGSWFDVIPLSSARVAFVVGDVAGHGLKATTTMGRLRTAVQTLADLDLAPDELLTRLDDLAVRLADTEQPATRQSTSGVLGATCLYCVYDPVTGGCVVASAGRPPPVFAAPGRDADFVQLKSGPPLGVGGLPFEPVELTLDPGTLLAFYTDELVASEDEDIEQGMERLRRRVAASARAHHAPADVGRSVLDGLLPAEPPANDVALLIARVRALPEDAVATWEFPADPVVVGRTRDLVTAQLAEWGLEELAFSTELIASELVTNSIRYAGGPVGLRLIKNETLVCEVSDPSQTQPHLRRARPTDEGGRGLYLIAQLAHRWGSRYTLSGKSIWTEQLLTQDSEHR